MTDPGVLGRLADLHEQMAKAYRALAQKAQAPSQGPDAALTIREACTLNGWSYSFARRHWTALGGYRDLDGKLKIRTSVARRKTP